MSINLTQSIPFKQSVHAYLQPKLDPIHQPHLEKFAFIVEEKIKTVFTYWWGQVQAGAKEEKFSKNHPDFEYYDAEGIELLSALFLKTYDVHTEFKTSFDVRKNELLPMLKGTVLRVDFTFAWHPFNPHLYPHIEPKRHNKYQIDPSQHSDYYWLSALNGLSTDVAFKVGSKIIKAHKFILDMSPLSSDNISALIESGPKMGNGKEIEIGKCNPEVFKEALQFIYTGKIGDSESYIDLFKFAHQFHLKELCNLCEDRIMENLSQKGVDENSFTDLIFLATLCDVHDLLLPCLKFADTCADEVDLSICPPESFPKMLTLAAKRSLDAILKRLEKEIVARMQA